MQRNDQLKVRTSNLRPNHPYFYQYAVARLMRAGMWFSDAIQVIQIVMPHSAHSLPDDYEHTFYDVTREALANKHLPIPTYKPIW